MARAGGYGSDYKSGVTLPRSARDIKTGPAGRQKTPRQRKPLNTTAGYMLISHEADHVNPAATSPATRYTRARIHLRSIHLPPSDPGSVSRSPSPQGDERGDERAGVGDGLGVFAHAIGGKEPC